MTATTATVYVVQTLLDSGDWIDASDDMDDLAPARAMIRFQPEANRPKFRIVERRVTTVEEVMP